MDALDPLDPLDLVDLVDQVDQVDQVGQVSQVSQVHHFDQDSLGLLFRLVGLVVQGGLVVLRVLLVLLVDVPIVL